MHQAIHFLWVALAIFALWYGWFLLHQLFYLFRAAIYLKRLVSSKTEAQREFWGDQMASALDDCDRYG